MKKKLTRRGRSYALVAILVAAGFLAGPALAQQNGTFCPESIINDPNGPELQLFLDSTCDAQGWPAPSEYVGSGAHTGCYTDFGETPGQTVSCSPCPQNWQNCTPCPNYDAQCGTHTPDPEPDGNGSFLRQFVHAVDWLTA